MNNKRFKIILLAAILFIITVFILWQNKVSLNNNNISITDTAGISEIKVYQNSAELLYFNKVNHQWMLNNEQITDVDKVSAFVKILNQLQLKATLNEQMRNQLISDLQLSGIEVHIQYNNGKSKKLYLSKVQPQLSCMYAMNFGSSNIVIVNFPGIENFKNEFIINISPQYWNNKTIWSFSAVDIIELRVENGENPQKSFLIKNTVNGLQLLNYMSKPVLEKLNYNALTNYLTKISALNYSDKADIPVMLGNLISDTSFYFRFTLFKVNHEKETVTFLKKYLPDNSLDYNNLYGVINNTDTVIGKYFNYDNFFKDINFFFEE